MSKQNKKYKRTNKKCFYSNFIKISLFYLRNAPIKFSIKDSRKGITSVVNVPLPSERLISYTKTSTGFQTVSRMNNSLTKQNENENSGAGNKEEENYDEDFLEKNQEELKKEIGFIQEEPYGVGLAGVLKKLRERGELNISSEDYSGELMINYPMRN